MLADMLDQDRGIRGDLAGLSSSALAEHVLVRTVVALCLHLGDAAECVFVCMSVRELLR